MSGWYIPRGVRLSSTVFRMGGAGLKKVAAPQKKPSHHGVGIIGGGLVDSLNSSRTGGSRMPLPRRPIHSPVRFLF